MEQYQREPDAIDKALGLGIVAAVALLFGVAFTQTWGASPQAAAATLAAMAASSLSIISGRVWRKDGPVRALLVALGHVLVVVGCVYIVVSPYIA